MDEIATRAAECRVEVQGPSEWTELDPDIIPFAKFRKTSLTEAVKIERPFQVITLEGTFQAKAGDYLMRGPAGELYSCDADIFASTYESADG